MQLWSKIMEGNGTPTGMSEISSIRLFTKEVQI